MDVEITEMPEIRVGVVRSDMAHVGEAQGRLWSAVGEAGLMGQPGVAGAAILPAEAITQGPQEQTRYDAAVIVPEGTEIPAELTEDRVPSGRYARAVHTGSYEGLPGAWGEFAGEWLPSSGHRVADGVCFEIYRSNPAEVPEAELRTELYIPIA